MKGRVFVVICGSVSLDLASMTLAMLMERPGRVVPREEFLDRVWGYTWIGETRTLDQHIRRLRRRLEVDLGAPGIETVRGVGHRLVDAEA